MPRADFLATARPERRALIYAVLLHVGVLGVILVLPYLHTPPKIEPPRVVEAVLVRQHTPEPAEPAAPAVVAPSPEPVVEARPEPVKKIPLPEPVKIPPKIPLPASKPIVPVKATPAKVVPEKIEPVKAAPAKPLIKKPTLNSSAFDAEMKALEKQTQDEEASRIKQQAEKSMAQTLSSNDSAIIAKYNDLIYQRIYRFTSFPPSARAGMTIKIRVTLLPGGEVASAIIVKSSGDAAVDDSAKAATLKASPLPTPDDPHLFNQFRSGVFTLRVN